jgi:hypothetical protein
MSYNDSRDYEPRRSSRRREPAGPTKVQGSTAAAILVFVAIVGFGIGAILANAGGGEDPDTTENDPAAAGSPTAPADDTADEPDDAQTEDSSDDGDEPAGGAGITLTSLQDGGDVAADESGTIGVQAALDSGEDGVTLSLERSLDNGQTWEPFCDNCTKETSGGGTFSSDFWSGRPGENQFRVVGPDGLVSNAIIVNLVEGSGDDDDNSGSGNGNGNGNDGDG